MCCVIVRMCFVQTGVSSSGENDWIIYYILLKNMFVFECLINCGEFKYYYLDLATFVNIPSRRPLSSNVDSTLRWRPLTFAALPSFVLLRYGRKWQKHLHQTDEDHPRCRLLGRRQEGLHPPRLPEHLHLHAGHDPGHRDAQDSLQVWAELGKTRVWTVTVVGYFGEASGCSMWDNRKGKKINRCWSESVSPQCS